MARKAKGTKPMQTAAEPKTKPVRLDLTPEDHRLLRIEAAKADSSMASFARDVLLEALRKRAGKD